MSQRVPPEVSAAYAPPSSESSRTHAELHENAVLYGYLPRAALVRVLSAWLIVEASLQGLNAGCCAVLASRLLTSAQDDSVSWVSHLVARVYLPVFLVGTVPFAWFLVGANKNARALTRTATARAVEDEDEDEDEDALHEQLRARGVYGFTPASMVWSFAVPFFNLVHPYLAVKAVWKASGSVRAEAPGASSSVVGQWWLAYLLAIAFARLGDVFPSHSVGYAKHDLIGALADLIGVASSLLALRMIMALQERQFVRAVGLWPTDFSRPSPTPE